MDELSVSQCCYVIKQGCSIVDVISSFLLTQICIIPDVTHVHSFLRIKKFRLHIHKSLF